MKSLIFSRYFLQSLHNIWQTKSLITGLLLPLSLLFWMVSVTRRFLYQKKILKSVNFDIPIIVVGNITVGGTGKTPVVIWLTNFLKQKGFKVGVLCSGYNGSDISLPVSITSKSDAYHVGDEAVHIYKRTQSVVVSCKHRVKAAKFLRQNFDLDVLICDDGLQHYKLVRDIEIHVLNGERGFGNEYLLPAGPMRESKNRLRNIDLKVVKGMPARGEYRLDYCSNYIYKINDPNTTENLHYLKDKRFLAIAGIANPREFFEILKQNSLRPIEMPFPDHHRYQFADFEGYENIPILMTEKDAVKCQNIKGFEFWAINLEYYLPKEFGEAVLKKLENL